MATRTGFPSNYWLPPSAVLKPHWEGGITGPKSSGFFRSILRFVDNVVGKVINAGLAAVKFVQKVEESIPLWIRVPIYGAIAWHLTPQLVKDVALTTTEAAFSPIFKGLDKVWRSLFPLTGFRGGFSVGAGATATLPIMPRGATGGW